MNLYAADLHIHTALSPCAFDEMSPPEIVRAAITRRLNMIAICDHNTAGNVAAVQRTAMQRMAAKNGGDGLVVIAGIELTTTEEVHVIGLFPDAESAMALAAKVLTTLPRMKRTPKGFLEQLLMDDRGIVVGKEKRMLSAASTLNLSAAVDLIRSHGGLAIAAHTDRPSFSVMSQLGLFPENVHFDAIEISPAGLEQSRQNEFASLGLPIIVSSDSHFLSDIGVCRTVFEMRAPTFEELVLAMAGAEGRSCRIA